MKFILNILWIILGGLEMAIGWLIVSFVFAISIVGLPWARAAFNMAIFHLWPFGREVVEREDITGREDLGTGMLGFIGNVIWFFMAGWWLALGHLFFALILGITIIGIPFAWQHVKLAMMALAPVGKMVIDSDVIEYRHDLEQRYLRHG